jgi:hypothetical protein
MEAKIVMKPSFQAIGMKWEGVTFYVRKDRRNNKRMS